MAISDMPNVPPQDTPVMIAQATQAQQGSSKVNRTVGVCRALSNPASTTTATTQYTLTPAGDVANYFYGLENRTLTGPSTVTVLEQPQHGKLEDLGTVAFNELRHSVRDTGARSYNYIPASGYHGKDHATVQVNIGDYTVKTEYVFQVATDGNKNKEALCPKTYWKVSSAGDGIALASEESWPN